MIHCKMSNIRYKLNELDPKIQEKSYAGCFEKRIAKQKLAKLQNYCT